MKRKKLWDDLSIVNNMQVCVCADGKQSAWINSGSCRLILTDSKGAYCFFFLEWWCVKNVYSMSQQHKYRLLGNILGYCYHRLKFGFTDRSKDAGFCFVLMAIDATTSLQEH